MTAYLDNSATTRPYDEVTEYMNYINRELYANPSSMHSMGFEAEKIIRRARETILSFLGDSEGRLIFTSGGTEANNLAIFGSVRHTLKRAPEIICGSTEHPSVSEPFAYLGENGARAELCRCDSRGRLDIADFKKKMNEKVSLVSLMLVNNEVGAIQPVEEVSRIIKVANPRALFHVDAVQAFGKIPVNVKKAGIDLLSISAHKINGPMGAGALYIRRGVSIKPVTLGGHQEYNLRSGTQNVPAIGGFMRAVEMISPKLSENAARMTELKNMLLSSLKKLPYCEINGGGEEYSAPNIVNVSFDKIRSEVLLHTLERRGVFVSSGSACASNHQSPSPTLTAMGLDKGKIDSAIRFSLCPTTTAEEIAYAAETVKEAAEELRK